MADSGFCSVGALRRWFGPQARRYTVVSLSIPDQNSMDSDAAMTMIFPPIFSIYMTNHRK
jgi:hypothetical protein